MDEKTLRVFEIWPEELASCELNYRTVFNFLCVIAQPAGDVFFSVSRRSLFLWVRRKDWAKTLSALSCSSRSNYFKFIVFSLLLCVCARVGMHTCTGVTAPMWRSEDSFLKVGSLFPLWFLGTQVRRSDLHGKGTMPLPAKLPWHLLPYFCLRRREVTSKSRDIQVQCSCQGCLAPGITESPGASGYFCPCRFSLSLQQPPLPMGQFHVKSRKSSLVRTVPLSWTFHFNRKRPSFEPPAQNTCMAD